MNLELVIRCKDCGEEVDVWDVDSEDPATSVCETAGSLRFRHVCPQPQPKDPS